MTRDQLLIALSDDDFAKSDARTIQDCAKCWLYERLKGLTNHELRTEYLERGLGDSA